MLNVRRVSFVRESSASASKNLFLGVMDKPCKGIHCLLLELALHDVFSVVLHGSHDERKQVTASDL